MKKIIVWLLAAASVMLICACGNKGEQQGPVIVNPEPVNTVNTGNTGDTQPDDSAPVSEDDTLPPREGMLRSRLTNEWVDAEVANTRPIAVVIPSEKPAIPHYNLSEASILYEVTVEGRMTRMLAIFEDWENLDKIGNIRSLRLYHGYWALEWDAFIVHVGGPFFIDEFLDQPNTQNINGVTGTDGSAFYLANDRKKPHNTYTSGEGLRAVIDKKGYSLSYRGLADDKHYQFAGKSNPNTLEQYTNAVTANTIDMTYCYPNTRCYFEYNADDGLYYRFQHLSGSTSGPHVDGATGEQLTFKNVLVQYTKHETLGIDSKGSDYLAFQCHDTTRDGWYFTNGRGIHVTWKKTSDYGATRYYDDSGNEIVMNTGKTMVLIVKDGDTFTYK